MQPAVQETLDEAMTRPGEPRVFAHVAGGCGGWVLFEVAGGRCVRCGACPVPPGGYAKPGGPS